MEIFLPLKGSGRLEAYGLLIGPSGRNNMTSQQDFIDQAAGIATCTMLSAGTARMAQMAMGSAITGQVWGVVGFGAATAAFAGLALGYGCFHSPDDPFGDAPPPDPEPPECCQISTLGGQLWAYLKDTDSAVPITTAFDCKQILDTYPVWQQDTSPGQSSQCQILKRSRRSSYKQCCLGS